MTGGPPAASARAARQPRRAAVPIGRRRLRVVWSPAARPARVPPRRARGPLPWPPGRPAEPGVRRPEQHPGGRDDGRDQDHRVDEVRDPGPPGVRGDARVTTSPQGQVDPRLPGVVGDTERVAEQAVPVQRRHRDQVEERVRAAAEHEGGQGVGRRPGRSPPPHGERRQQQRQLDEHAGARDHGLGPTLRQVEIAVGAAVGHHQRRQPAHPDLEHWYGVPACGDAMRELVDRRDQPGRQAGEDQRARLPEQPDRLATQVAQSDRHEHLHRQHSHQQRTGQPGREGRAGDPQQAVEQRAGGPDHGKGAGSAGRARQAQGVPPAADPGPRRRRRLTRHREETGPVQRPEDLSPVGRRQHRPELVLVGSADLPQGQAAVQADHHEALLDADLEGLARPAHTQAVHAERAAVLDRTEHHVGPQPRPGGHQVLGVRGGPLGP